MKLKTNSSKTVVFKGDIPQASALKSIFKRDKHGNILRMDFEVEGDKYRAISGVEDGARKVGAWTVAVPKNVGRANETTAEEQAMFKCIAKRTKELDRHGYHENKLDVDNRPSNPIAMLAHTFDWKKRKPALTFPIIGQPKLNGGRCLAEGDKLWTRYGNEWKNAGEVPRIFANLAVSVGSRWPDGELYNHEFRERLDDFMSIIRTEKPTAEDRALAEKHVQYHIYDCIFPQNPDAPFLERYAAVEKIVKAKNKVGEGHIFKLVPMRMLHSYEEVWAYYEEMLAAGYEGIMLRDPKAPYDHCRTVYLLKMKPRFNGEFTVERAAEGKGKNKGVLSKFYCIAKKDTWVEDKWLIKKGTQFKCNMRGPFAKRKQMWAEKEKFVGKLITVSCAYVTQQGALFHPYYESFVGTQRKA